MIERFAGFLFLAAAMQTSMAEVLTEPFSVSNLNPFVRVQGVPATRSAILAGAGRVKWQVHTGFASHFTESSSGGESISLDGETHVATLSAFYGLNDRWEFGVQIPWLHHTGGSLDSFIENWHDTFGLPNGGREDVRDDQLAFLHSVDGMPTTTFTRGTSGLGDIQLHAAYRLKEDPGKAWTLRAGVKLPTGDAGRLTGSEGGALFLSAHHSSESLLAHPDWTFHGSFGAAYYQDGEVLENLQKNWMTYGSATVAWQATPRMNLKVQLDAHSAAYDSRLKELGDPAALLVLGGSLRISENMLLDISVSEDIVTDTSPDVVLQLGLRASF